MHTIIFFKKQFRCVIFKFAKFFILPAICFNFIGQNRENRAILIGWRRLGIVSLLKDFSISSAFGNREWGVGADRMDAKTSHGITRKERKVKSVFPSFYFYECLFLIFLDLSLSMSVSIPISLLFFVLFLAM